MYVVHSKVGKLIARYIYVMLRTNDGMHQSDKSALFHGYFAIFRGNEALSCDLRLAKYQNRLPTICDRIDDSELSSSSNNINDISRLCIEIITCDTITPQPGV